MDRASTASSFYEAPVQYDEGKTRNLYDTLKTNFQDIQELLIKANNDLHNIQKETLLTMQLIRKLETTTSNSNKSSEQ